MELICDYCGGKLYKNGFSKTQEHYQLYRCSKCKKVASRHSAIYGDRPSNKNIRKSEPRIIKSSVPPGKMDWRKLYEEVFGDSRQLAPIKYSSNNKRLVFTIT